MAKEKTVKPEAVKSVWSKLKPVPDAWDELIKYGRITNNAGLTPANKKLIENSPHGVIKFTDGKTIIKVIRLNEGVYEVWGTPGIPDGIVQEIEGSLFKGN